MATAIKLTLTGSLPARRLVLDIAGDSLTALPVGASYHIEREGLSAGITKTDQGYRLEAESDSVPPSLSYEANTSTGTVIKSATESRDNSSIDLKRSAGHSIGFAWGMAAALLIIAIILILKLKK